MTTRTRATRPAVRRSSDRPAAPVSPIPPLAADATAEPAHLTAQDEVILDPLPRPDWRESVALAADLALLGIVVTLACLPVVTAGAALSTASVAVDQVCTHRTFPSLGELARTFRRSLLPGMAAVLVVLVVGALLALDATALRSGAVPGGPVLLAVTALLAAAGYAVAAVALVRLGQTGGRGYRDALRWSLRQLAARPMLGAALVLTIVLPILLAATIAVTTPLLPGFVLFGLHVVVRRKRPR
jgi:Protein of unknown function, DUF624